MNLKIKKIICLALIVMVGLMAGCSKPRKTKWVYKSSKSNMAMRKQALEALRAKGVDVCVYGESIKIILPDRLLFKPDSLSLDCTVNDVLQNVVRYIKTYSVVKVNVNAYSDKAAWAGSPHYRKVALTTRQARAVAKYLWASGIDMRMVAAKGYGSKRNVAWNGSPKGRSFNRRVEIAFHFYPHLVAYR